MVLSDQKISQLCGALAMLLQAGVMPADGCFLLAREEADPLLTHLGEGLDRGKTLSQAMADSGVFPPEIPAIIRVGEDTGRLEEALRSLADHYAYRDRTARQLRQALIGPCLILVLVLTVLTVLLVKVLPVFQQVYASLGGSLTGPGLWLLKLGQGIASLLPVLLTAAAAVCLTVGALCCHRGLGRRGEAFWRRHFGDRGFLRKFHNARFARGLAMAVSSGLEFAEGAQLAALPLARIPGAARRCEKLRQSLEAGGDPAGALEEAKLFTPAQSRLLAVGLRSGNGEGVLTAIARQQEEAAAESLEAAAAVLEPAMVLVASVLVGGILLSVMLPLMNILSAMG